MELIYLYVDGYKNLRNFEIQFSQKIIINYRNNKVNYRQTSNETESNIYALVGKNGAGKSAILEAIKIIGTDANYANLDYFKFIVIFRDKQRLYYDTNIDALICDKHFSPKKIGEAKYVSNSKNDYLERVLNNFRNGWNENNKYLNPTSFIQNSSSEYQELNIQSNLLLQENLSWILWYDDNNFIQWMNSLDSENSFPFNKMCFTLDTKEEWKNHLKFLEPIYIERITDNSISFEYIQSLMNAMTFSQHHSFMTELHQICLEKDDIEGNINSIFGQFKSLLFIYEIVSFFEHNRHLNLFDFVEQIKTLEQHPEVLKQEKNRRLLLVATLFFSNIFDIFTLYIDEKKAQIKSIISPEDFDKLQGELDNLDIYNHFDKIAKEFYLRQSGTSILYPNEGGLFDFNIDEITDLQFKAKENMSFLKIRLQEKYPEIKGYSELFLELFKCKFYKQGDIKYGFESLSDGEKEKFSFLISYFGYLKGNGTLLLDEPMQSYHPEWQSKFLYYINEVQKQINNVTDEKAAENKTIIFTTHSPLLIKDLSPENIITITKDEDGNAKASRKSIEDSIQALCGDLIGVTRESALFDIEYNLKHTEKNIILCTEGVTDPIIINAVFRSLYGDVETPFLAINLFNCNILAEFFKNSDASIFKDFPNKTFIALFDNDEAGNRVWNEFNDTWHITDKSVVFEKKKDNLYIWKIPVPEWREDIKSTFLEIEFLLKDEDLKRPELCKYLSENRIDKYKVTNKLKFANMIDKNYTGYNFDGFKPLFETIKEILE